MMLSPMSWRAASRVSGETAEGPVVAEDWADTKMGAEKRTITNRKGFMRMAGDYSAFRKVETCRRGESTGEHRGVLPAGCGLARRGNESGKRWLGGTGGSGVASAGLVR